MIAYACCRSGIEVLQQFVYLPQREDLAVAAHQSCPVCYARILEASSKFAHRELTLTGHLHQCVSVAKMDIEQDELQSLYEWVSMVAVKMNLRRPGLLAYPW